MAGGSVTGASIGDKVCDVRKDFLAARSEQLSDKRNHE